MTSATSPLAVLRHALADPLSAATAKAEVLAARLRREVPGLAVRAEGLGRDLEAAGRLLDLLSTLAEIGEEPAEPVPLERLVSPFGAAAGTGAVRVRPASAQEAIRRVVSFGSSRGGAPRVSCASSVGRGEVRVRGLGGVPDVPPERLLLLPRDVPGTEDLFLARAAVQADSGALDLFLDDSGLAATLSWPLAEGEP